VDSSLVEVRISPGSVEAYRGLVAGAEFAIGTTAAAFHRSPDGAAGSVYAMTKLPSATGGQWEFIVTEPDGTLLARGSLSLCAGCHDDAPADHLFGVPRPADPPNLPRN
jgi:hypothetical protein